MGVLISYAVQRLWQGLTIPAAILVATASLLERGPSLEWWGFGEVVWRVLWVWVVLAAFRIREDLESAEDDRLVNPARVMARVKDRGGFWWVWLVLMVVCVMVLDVWREGWGAVWFGLSVAAFEVGVRWKGVGRGSEGLWVLVKYPVLTWVLMDGAQVSWVHALLSGALVALVFVALEVADDAVFMHKTPQGAPAAYTVLMVLLGVLIAVSLRVWGGELGAVSPGRLDEGVGLVVAMLGGAGAGLMTLRSSVWQAIAAYVCGLVGVLMCLVAGLWLQ